MSAPPQSLLPSQNLLVLLEMEKVNFLNFIRFILIISLSSNLCQPPLPTIAKPQFNLYIFPVFLLIASIYILLFLSLYSSLCILIKQKNIPLSNLYVKFHQVLCHFSSQNTGWPLSLKVDCLTIQLKLQSSFSGFVSIICLQGSLLLLLPILHIWLL